LKDITRDEVKISEIVKSFSSPEEVFLINSNWPYILNILKRQFGFNNPGISTSEYKSEIDEALDSVQTGKTTNITVQTPSASAATPGPSATTAPTGTTSLANDIPDDTGGPSDKILLYTPLLKWYLEHGLEITKFYQAITYTPKQCFKGIADDIANARRAGDVDEDMAIIAETMKLIGNALYGRTVMDKEKHTTTSFCGLDKISKRINDPHFKDLEELSDNRFEVMAGKHKIIMDTPIQIGCAVYQLAKLRMLQFYYDCLDKYVDRSDFQYIEMDTDSAYLALSGDKLEDVIKPHMKEEYEKDKYNWFPDETTKELKAYNKRTPGLFKVEFEGNSIYALCSKLYFVEGVAKPLDPKKEEEKAKNKANPNYLEDDEEEKKDKYSCKGIQKKQNEINKDRFHNVLFNDVKDMCKNKGFRVINNEMITYIQHTKGLSYYYDKRLVLPDAVESALLVRIGSVLSSLGYRHDILAPCISRSESFLRQLEFLCLVSVCIPRIHCATTRFVRTCICRRVHVICDQLSSALP
jgi:hypothetical protein